MRGQSVEQIKGRECFSCGCIPYLSSVRVRQCEYNFASSASLKTHDVHKSRNLS